VAVKRYIEYGFVCVCLRGLGTGYLDLMRIINNINNVYDMVLRYTHHLLMLAKRIEYNINITILSLPTTASLSAAAPLETRQDDTTPYPAVQEGGYI
jgi:hypothetical protein